MPSSISCFKMRRLRPRSSIRPPQRPKGTRLPHQDRSQPTFFATKILSCTAMMGPPTSARRMAIAGRSKRTGFYPQTKALPARRLFTPAGVPTWMILTICTIRQRCTHFPCPRVVDRANNLGPQHVCGRHSADGARGSGMAHCTSTGPSD